MRRFTQGSDTKHKHQRASQAINGPKAAPVLEFAFHLHTPRISVRK